MRLKDIFVERALERGIEKIYAPRLKKSDPLAFLASQIASGKISLYKPKRSKRLCITIYGEIVEGIPDAYAGRGDEKAILDKNDLIDLSSHFPYIVIDCSLRDIHSQKELVSLDRQIRKTLSVVRKFMWDERLVVTAFNSGISALHYPSTEEFLEKMSFEKVVLLDPIAEERFQGERAECFIIGGIVDRSGNKEGATEKIYRRLEKSGIDVERRRIELRGDIIGVPDRINLIAEIVLRAVLDGCDVEKAIYLSQSRKIARWRLRKEIVKESEKVDINGRKFRFIRKSFFKDVSGWLKVNEEDFYRCARDMGIIVIDDSLTPKRLKVKPF